ncbi:hypothetical protein I6F13_31895 [Bradyrhizobium sp. IC4061]|nr:hypothetical protein [Bradyrhizobium sp. IC4061]
MLALPAAEEPKHVNWPVESPLTIFIKQTLDIRKTLIVDGPMQGAR